MDRRVVLLVDGYNTFIRSFLQIPIRNENGEHFGGVFGFLNSVRSVCEKIHPNEIVITWDGVDSAFRRRQILPEYKEHRRTAGWTRGSVRAFDFETPEQQKENFNYQILRIREYIKRFPFKEIQLPYVEADDIIAEYVQAIERSQSNDTKYEVLIYSSDGDYKQLIREKEKINVYCYNPISKVITSKESFIEKHGFLPENYPIVKSIIGDVSDNISGVRGIGEKTINQLYPMLRVGEVSIQSILNFSKEVSTSSMKLSESKIKKYGIIVENSDRVLINWRVVNLVHGTDISIQSKEAVVKLLTSPRNEFDKHTLFSMFMKDKMQSQIGKFAAWNSIIQNLN